MHITQDVGKPHRSNHVDIAVIFISATIIGMLVAVTRQNRVATIRNRIALRNLLLHLGQLAGSVRHSAGQFGIQLGNINKIATDIIQVVRKGVTKGQVGCNIKYLIDFKTSATSGVTHYRRLVNGLIYAN